MKTVSGWINFIRNRFQALRVYFYAQEVANDSLAYIKRVEEENEKWDQQFQMILNLPIDDVNATDIILRLQQAENQIRIEGDFHRQRLDHTSLLIAEATQAMRYPLNYNRPIYIPPGSILLRIAQLLLPPRTVNQIIKQDIADWRAEHRDAIRDNDWLRALCVNWRYRYGILRSLGLDRIRSLIKTLLWILSWILSFWK
jgi:hypothetical protein